MEAVNKYVTATCSKWVHGIKRCPILASPGCVVATPSHSAQQLLRTIEPEMVWRGGEVVGKCGLCGGCLMTRGKGSGDEGGAVVGVEWG